MKVTIAKTDNIVGIDGYFINTSLSSLPTNLRVVQWDGTNGHEEWTDRANTVLTSISEYQQVIDTWVSIKAEIDAKAADPYYGMTLEERQRVIRDAIFGKEEQRNSRKIEHPQIPGAFFKPSDKIDKIIGRSDALNNSDPLPTNGGSFDDIDENPVPMTVGQLKKLRNAIIDRVEANYLVRKQHIKDMKLVANPLIYDYTTGWN